MADKDVKVLNSGIRGEAGQNKVGGKAGRPKKPITSISVGEEWLKGARIKTCAICKKEFMFGDRVVNPRSSLRAHLDCVNEVEATGKELDNMFPDFCADEVEIE